MSRGIRAAEKTARVCCLALTGLAVAACSTYRVEYHKRPGFYRNTAAGPQPDQVTLDDGTVLVFSTREPTSELTRQADSDSRPFQIREEFDDGTIVLRALLPQHVLANTLTCLRNQEYELIWEQLLAEQTRRAYELQEQGLEECEEFFSANRNELVAMLTRLLMGLVRGEAFMENVDGGVVRFRFHPRVATAFQFKTADIISEGGGLKLLMIR
ncbi:MAG: hypothetical protein ACYTE6_10710 [Planctomycetota bacterium]|jgi:hypothetical protein